jgi:hypothetical protein
MAALSGRHLVDKAIFLALDYMAGNLPKLREYVGGPPVDVYELDDRRLYIDCRVRMEPEQAREYKRIEDILVSTCREMIVKGSMRLLGACCPRYLTGYNPFPMQEAARRTWRIGQSQDCRVYYLHHACTVRQRAMALMARKAAAMAALDGKLDAEGLAAMADDGSVAMALARSISNDFDGDDMQRSSD